MDVDVVLAGLNDAGDIHGLLEQAGDGADREAGIHITAATELGGADENIAGW